MTGRMIAILVALSVLLWAAWLALVLYTPPDLEVLRTSFFGLILLASATSFTLVIGLINHWLVAQSQPTLARAVVQGVGLAALVTAALALQSERMLTPVHVVMFIGAWMLVNLLFLSGRAS